MGRSRSQLQATAVVAIAGALTLAAWWWASPPGWRQSLATVVWAVAVAHAIRQGRAATAGRVRWDGAYWMLETTGRTQAAAAVEVTLDLQSTMLLRWRPMTGPAGWVWLEQWRCPARWDDVRRAVYSRASNDPLQDPDTALRAHAAP